MTTTAITTTIVADMQPAATLEPILYEYGLVELLTHSVRLWTIKLSVWFLLLVHRWWQPARADSQPQLVKSYPCRPMLRNRIFYPPDYFDHKNNDRKAGNKSGKLPLYLDIHGGGFAFGDPALDDEFCSAWAKRTGFLVVSLDYRKTPLHRYPTPVLDIAAVACAVLDDESLPIDKTRVVIGGFSAGGTLALSASQLPGLKGVVKAVIPFYPAIDWSTHPRDKFLRRLYRERSIDTLEKTGPCMAWGYVTANQDRRDPVLSPIFARREDLPPWVMMVAPQHDILTIESRELILRLADIAEPNEEEKLKFEKGTYKWRLVMNTTHGFTHELGRGTKGRSWRMQQTEQVYAEAYDWLMRGPLA